MILAIFIKKKDGYPVEGESVAILMIAGGDGGSELERRSEPAFVILEGDMIAERQVSVMTVVVVILHGDGRVVCEIIAAGFCREILVLGRLQDADTIVKTGG